MPRLRKVLIGVLIYFFGVGTMVLVGAILVELELPPGDPMYVAKHWQISEPVPGTLLVPVPGSALRLQVQVDPSRKDLKTIRISHSEGDGLGIVFEYNTAGEFGVPEAQYGGGELNRAVIWVDVKVDGTFDKRYDVRRKVFEIWDGQAWRQAKNAGMGVETEAGVFQYNAKAGQWQAVKE